MFEGEYFNGLRIGQGKEYHDKDKLIFEGEYLNGKRWNGKEYHDDDDDNDEDRNRKVFN